MSTTGGHFSATFLLIFKVFGLFGLAPYKLTADGWQEDGKHLICSIIFLILIPGPYCYSMLEQEKKQATYSLIVKTYDSVTKVTKAFSFFLMLGTVIMKRSAVVKILNKFIKFDKTSGLSSTTDTEFKPVILIFGTVAYVIYLVLYMFADANASSRREAPSFANLSVVLVINVVRYSFLAKHALLHNVLKKKFQAVRCKLERSQRKHSEIFKIKDALSVAQTLYHELWTLSQCFGVFSNIILLELLTTTLWIGTFSYFLILLALKGDESLYVILLAVVLLLGEIGRLLMVIRPCVSTKKEASKVLETLHRIGASFKDSEVAMFSLQLYHEQVSFTAGGSIEINENLLYSISGLVCTHLAIILQLEISSLYKAIKTWHAINQDAFG